MTMSRDVMLLLLIREARAVDRQIAAEDEVFLGADQTAGGAERLGVDDGDVPGDDDLLRRRRR